MKKQLENRHGKHDEGLVGFSAHIKPELKALVQVTANELNSNMVAVMIAGFEHEATRAGVMADGVVVEKYKPVVAMYAESYRIKKQENKAKAKAKKGAK